MSAMKWICAMVLGLGFSSTAQSGIDTCQMKTLATLDVPIDSDGTVLMPVTIDGHDVWMSLALNSGLPILYSGAVEGWNIQTRPNNLGATVNGKQLYMTTVKELKLGMANFTNWDLVLLPRNSKGIEVYEGKPVVGQFTSRLIQLVDVEINLAQNKVNLFSQTKCSGGALYWGGEYTAAPLYSGPSGLLRFSMELDGRHLETSLNTYGSASVINSEVTKKYFGFDETSSGIEKQNSRRGNVTESYRAMSLTARGLTVRNTRIQLQSGISCGASYTGSVSGALTCERDFNHTPFSIGTDLLRSLRVYIASKEGMIYFTRVDPVVPSAAPNAEPAQ